jgi:hypothetical protein
MIGIPNSGWRSVPRRNKSIVITVIASEELLSGEMISAMHPIVVLCRPSEQK